MAQREHRYGLVLLLTIASIIVQLSVSGSDGARFAVLVLQAATLVAAVHAAGARQRTARVSVVVAVAAVAAGLVTWVVRGDLPPAPVAVVNGLLVAVAPVVLARGLLADLRGGKGVAVPTLAGVLSIYLLSGMFFSFVYGVIDAVDAEALFAGRVASTASEQLYFSFVTLCTVGYGDYSPGAELPRALAVAEMLIGQIYLVTIVSLIVANLGARAARPS